MTGQYYNTNVKIILCKIFICSEILRIKNILHKPEQGSSRKVLKVLVLNSHDHNIVNVKKVNLEYILLHQRIF